MNGDFLAFVVWSDRKGALVAAEAYYPGDRLVRVRGALADRAEVSTELDPYRSFQWLKKFTDLSERTLRRAMRDPRNPLPYYRPYGRLRFKKSEVEAWLQRYRQVGSPDVDRIVRSVLEGSR